MFKYSLLYNKEGRREESKYYVALSLSQTKRDSVEEERDNGWGSTHTHTFAFVCG